MANITVKEFKEKIIPGNKIRSELYWADNNTGELYLRVGHLERVILRKNSVGFVMWTWYDKENKFVAGECFWPKQKELEQINETTFSITTLHEGKVDSKIIYELL